MTRTSIGLVVLGFGAGMAAHAVLARAQTRPAIADGPAAAPDKYRVELENEYVRVVRVTYPAHASGAMHAHPAPGAVIVALTDQTARVEGQDGSTREIHAKAGEVRWAAATPGKDLSTFSAHAEENLADRPFEILRIEPKTRH
jgi:quercetin dioxygenase-like cupin family protein